MDSRETRGQSGFTTTDWSAVARAAEPKAEGHRISLEQLLTRYLPALRSHLVRRMRLPPDRADDVLQGFVTNKILEAGLLTAARKERGRFRTLLLTALCNY